MAKKVNVSALMCLVVLLTVEAAPAPPPPADCTPTKLQACLGAISGGQEPSQVCCGKLKEQQPCFCKYIANPAYKPYVSSPNARKVAATCNVTIPAAC